MHVAVAAEAYVRATQAAAAGGQRIIVKSGPFFYQDLREFYFVPIFNTRNLMVVTRKTS